LWKRGSETVFLGWREALQALDNICSVEYFEEITHFQGLKKLTGLA
jgi:hypothetical protein